jgi:hypothetical protein
MKTFFPPALITRWLSKAVIESLFQIRYFGGWNMIEGNKFAGRICLVRGKVLKGCSDVREGTWKR